MNNNNVMYQTVIYKFFGVSDNNLMYFLIPIRVLIFRNTHNILIKEKMKLFFVAYENLASTMPFYCDK